MKKITLLILFGLLSSIVQAQNVNIPDVTFKNALLNHGRTISGTGLIDTDLNGQISVAEASAYTGTINAAAIGISDLTGIEAFTALTVLYCNNNSLTSLDVSANTALTILNCRQNQLSSLNVSANTALTELACFSNQLSSLDVSANIALTKLYCDNNQLTSLNVANGNNGNMTNMRATSNSNLTCIQTDAGIVGTNPNGWLKDATASYSANCSACTNIVNIPDANFKAALVANGVINTNRDTEIQCTEATAFTGIMIVSNKNISDFTGIEAFTALTGLDCSGNAFTNIDISQNTALTRLWCNNNSLSSLDVSQNTALQRLYCTNNSLSSLDVSNNSALQRLYCTNNSLSSLNVANGNNGALNSQLYIVDAKNNPNLTCIQHDTGFDPTTNNGWTKDTTASWSTTPCSTSTCTNIVNIPDTNFKAALLDHGVGITGTNISVIDTDGDGEICATEASAYTGTINVVGKNISNLTGIEAFTALTKLSCNYNSLTSLDVSANTTLTELYCNSNQLTSLDVSANTALINLECFVNQLTSLDVSANTALTLLNCNNNQLTSLDVSANTALTFLNFYNNQLSSLNVSTNTALINLTCSYNQLTSLNIANGNNANMTYMAANSNTNLTCIQTDAGIVGTNPSNWYKDAGASYSANCSTSTCTNIVNIPDANFKAALLDHGVGITGTGISVIDTDGDGEICQSEAQAYTGTINVSNKSISDLTGIETFTALTRLDCYNNQLSSLDVSANTALRQFYCSYSQLTSLNIANGNNTNMVRMYAQGNPNLTCIQIDANYTPSTSGSWQKDAGASYSANCSTSTCTNIVNIPDVNFKAALLDHGVGITGTGISVIDTDGDGEICANEASAYTGTIDVHSKNISDLTGIEAFTALTELSCYNNQLSGLDVSANTALIKLTCTSNQLSSLDVSANTALTELYCQNNQLSSLDVSASTALTKLLCNNNQLTSLNIANGNNANMTSMWANTNTNLTCIQTDAGIVGTTPMGWSKDAGASYSANCGTSTCTNIVNIPDANFKAALLDHGVGITGTGISVIDTDGDGEICQSEAQAYTGTIKVNSKLIGVLTGLEAFTGLTFLECSNNNLTSLDVSMNTALTKLNCSINSLTSLDVSANTALTELWCNRNNINSLDVSANTSLTVFACDTNSLTTLNVANGNNANITFMRANNNSSLTCIQHDSGFDPTTNSDWYKDASTSWSTNCTPDTVAPTVATQNITIQLDANGNATITPQQIDNGSTDDRDAIADLTFALDKTTFDCSNIGANTVTLTVTDTSSNSANATATVTVEDVIQPTVVTQNITAQLNASGNATITPQQVDNGSTDNCSIASMSLDKTSFTCADLGTNQVVLTVVDANGNSNTATATVTVEDSIAPTAVAQNLSVQLGTNGQVSVTPAQINNGSSDNCTSAANLMYSLSQTNFTCNNLGVNNVTLTVADANGNQATATAVLTVSQNPNAQLAAVTQNITVQLDANGQATITPQQIDNGSGSGCNSNPTLSLDKTTFDCSNVGANTVTLTATDNGNSVTGTAVVTVQDATQPTIIAQNITVQLDASGNATITPQQVDNGSTDNCSIASMSLDKTSFTCADLGTNQVVLTVVDANGNSNTATATVTVEDSIAPTAVAQNISVQLGTNNQVTITPAQINNGSSDNCTSASNLTYSLDTTTFSCSEVGANNVVLTVTDASGNNATANAVVTVTANPTAPLTAVTQNITVQLDANGNATIQPSAVDNGSGSGCNSNPTLSLDKTTFDCSNIGANTVTLTATDGGVSATATATVTVEDTMAPTVNTKDVTVTLNNGQGTITASDINDNSTDNCSVASTSLDTTSFTCADLGANTVTLTVTDGQGNVATGTATVTVVETDTPVVVTQNITVALDANGEATITAQQIDNGSSDACSGIASMSLDTTSFQCPDLSTPQTVTLTVTDNSGNTATGTATVTFTAPDEDNDGISDACDTREVIAPKGFSPNNDGLNDTWVIENIEKFPNSNVQVFNRWGERVYESNGYQNNWNGTSNSSTKLPVGAYYYIINLNDSNYTPVQGWLYINY